MLSQSSELIIGYLLQGVKHVISSTFQTAMSVESTTEVTTQPVTTSAETTQQSTTQGITKDIVPSRDSTGHTLWVVIYIIIYSKYEQGFEFDIA